LKQIRILLARMPEMLCDVLGHIVTSEPDMVLAGQIIGDEDLLAAVQRTRANVVVAQQDTDDEREKYASLLLRRPRLRLVAIAGDGRTGLLYELRPQRVALGKMSADTLRKSIRGPAWSTTHATP
jgi:hypothetical protein